MNALFNILCGERGNVALPLYFGMAMAALFLMLNVSPSCTRFRFEQKQDHAKSDLHSILRFQKAYHEEFGTYALSLSELKKWVPEDISRYSYSIVEANATHFVARAQGNIDKDPTLDVWEIDEKEDLINATNDAEKVMSRTERIIRWVLVFVFLLAFFWIVGACPKGF